MEKSGAVYNGTALVHNYIQHDYFQCGIGFILLDDWCLNSNTHATPFAPPYVRLGSTICLLANGFAYDAGSRPVLG